MIFTLCRRSENQATMARYVLCLGYKFDFNAFMSLKTDVDPLETQHKKA